MKAVHITGYGGPEVLVVKDTDRPVVDDHSIMVQNYAAALTRADAMMRSGTPKFARLFLGLKRPKQPIIGTGFAGIVTEVGILVKDFKVGDRVFGETKFNFSSNAEWVKATPGEDVIKIIPEQLNFAQAATLCDSALTSYNFLVNLAQLQAGQRLLVNGASGALGLSAVQIGKIIGAKITAVCSGRNAELVKRYGADQVVDYQQEDFTQLADTYDVIYDAIGKSSFGAARRVLQPKGQYLSPVLSLSLLFQSIFSSKRGQRARFDATGMRSTPELEQFLDQLIEWIKQEKLPHHVERTYTINEVAAAHDYIDSGRKRGNIALALSHA